MKYLNSLKCLVALTTMMSLAVSACGGISRTALVEQRPETNNLIPHLHAAAKAEGLPSKSDGERSVKFYLDRTTGTRMYFNVKRKGLVMAIKVDDKKVLGADAQQAEFVRAEAVGQRLLANARQRLAAKQAAQQAADARAAELAEERRKAAAAAPQPQPAFRNPVMDRMKQRMSLKRMNRKAASKTAAVKKSNYCCVNKQYFSCPSAAAVDKCAGKHMRCLSGCGMTMDCMMKCQKSAPMDTSSCRRDSGLDAQCSR